MEYEKRYCQVQKPQYDCLLFDLDDTLYPYSSGIATACRKNIEDYMVEKLGIDEKKIPEMCDLLYRNYGTTMAGLRAVGYEFNYDDYHSFVHGRLPYGNLKPDPVLRNLLLSLPLRKVIFTNGDKMHAAEVLSRLGLEDCFEGIICFETLNTPKDDSCVSDEDDSESELSKPTSSSGIFDIIEHFSGQKNAGVDHLPRTPVMCKPSEKAIQHALDIAKINPERTIFFDDSVRNIQAGKRVGLHTVVVGTSHRPNGADFALESIHNIREALPELREEAQKLSGVRYSGKLTIETSVTA